MAWLKRVLISLLVFCCCAFVLLFCLRNTLLVDIDLFFVKLIQVPVELAIVSSFILGGVFGVLSSLALILRMRKKYRQALSLAKKQV